MKQLILLISFSFFIMNCCYAQQQTLKLGEHNVDGLKLIIKERYPGIQSSTIIVTNDIEGKIKRTRGGGFFIPDISDRTLIPEIFKSVVGNKLQNEKGIIIVLYPDKVGRIANHVGNIELIIDQSTSITLSEIKKIFDQIQKEVWLNLPEKVATEDIRATSQTIN